MTKSFICACLKGIRWRFPLKDTVFIPQTHLVLNSSLCILDYIPIYTNAFNIWEHRKHQAFWNQAMEPCQSRTPLSSMPCTQGGANREGFGGGRHFKPSLKGKERRQWEQCFLIMEEQGWQDKGGSRKAVCLDSRGIPYQTREILPTG